jgi:hypothetical protein
MVVRTPPGHIYTSTLHRRERAWGRARRHRRRKVDVAALALSLLVIATVAVAILAPAAS